MGDDHDSNERPVADLVAGAAAAFAVELAGTEEQSLVDAVAGAVEPVRLARGEVLFEAGDPSEAAYLIVTGRLLAYAEREGEERALRHMGHGSILGELGLLDDSPRTASIKAECDSVLARLPKAAFHSISQAHPEFARGVTAVVIGRLARRSPPTDRIGAVALAVTAPGVDGAGLVSQFAAAIGERGTVATASGADLRSADSIETARRLDLEEASHDFVILDLGARDWPVVAIRRADRLVVVASGAPDDDERRSVARLVDTAREASLPVWLAITDGDAAGMRARFNTERVLRIDPADAASVARVARLASGTGVGLVLGGGGARGYAHLGVQQALDEVGVPIDAVGGASIGAIFGAGIAAGLAPQEFQQIASERLKRVLDYTLPLASMIKARRITRNLRLVFGEQDIEDLPRPFFCLSTNLTTAEQMVHDSGDLIGALRAGSSIPGVIPPVPDDGSLLVDAGVLNNLPIDVMRGTGMVDTVLAVDVAPPVGPGARDDYGLSLSGWRVLGDRLKPGRRRFPRLSSVLMRSMITGSMRERDRMVDSGLADLYLSIDMRGTSILDFKAGKSMMQVGYREALPRIREWWEARS